MCRRVRQQALMLFTKGKHEETQHVLLGLFFQPGVDASKNMSLSQMSSMDGGSPSMSPSASQQSLPTAALITSSSSSRPRFHSSSQLTGHSNNKGTLPSSPAHYLLLLLSIILSYIISICYTTSLISYICFNI